MQEDRIKVPVYGQEEASVTLRAAPPQDAELYVVVQGSALTHVTRAKRGSDALSLSFVVPGHALEEVATLTCFSCVGQQIQPIGCEESSVTYLRDAAQEAAEYLSANLQQLGRPGHQEVLERFSRWAVERGRSPGPAAGLGQLDEEMARAVVNMVYLQQWDNADAQPGVEAAEPIETLLAGRLGLVHLSHHSMDRMQGQGQRAVTPWDGEVPLESTVRNGQRGKLADRSAPRCRRCVRRLWSDGSCTLGFVPGSEQVTLTVRRAPGGCPEDAVMILQDKLGDESIVRLIDGLKADGESEKRRDGFCAAEEGLAEDLQAAEHAAVDDVFQEHLVLCLDDDDDNHFEESSSAKGHAMQSGESQCAAKAPPTAASTEETTEQQTQLEVGGDGGGGGEEDQHKFSISGVTEGSTATESEPWDPVDSPSPPSGADQPQSVPSSPLVSLADQALARLSRSASHEPSVKPETPPTMDTCDLSLVALEVDSEEDVSSDATKDKDADIRPSPDLTCTRSQSASTPCGNAAKEPAADQGIRLRSYSYSKISLRPARFSRDSPAADASSEHRASSIISEQLHEKRIEEEELDKYSIPVKVESEKYKVIRTFSFLKSRMSSTRNKTKAKGKEKEREANGHRFSTGACLGSVVCMVCDKQASGKELLHCAGCTAIVHKSCKDSLPPCLKKVQDKYAVASVKSRTASLPQNFTVRDSAPQGVVPLPTPLPAGTVKERRDGGNQSGSPSGSLPNSDSSETESDACKANGRSEEQLPTPGSSTSTDSSFGDDAVDSCVLSDLSADAADYEAESWSLAVEPQFCKRQEKRAVKRQDVIYELMQTELHHLQTLHVMAEVFRRGMRREVQLDAEAVERVFPCLDQLLVFHRTFFSAMRERRLGSALPPGHRNYLVQRIGDVLLQQFSDDSREKMKQVYGEFCSRHNEAVGFFKELQQHNKRFQNFIKQQGNNSLVKRREIPECILLVTQRITKYPVLLERILQHTEEGTEEHADLSKALCQVREVIAAVDLSVSEYERHQRLQEVCGRMENRSGAKLKNGHTFRKQDMMRPGQVLQHQGVLLWKSATGRLKDVLALLLTDTLIFLQDKDQKYTFAAVDQKPPVIALQKLIVREVANQEKGMFLISASAAGPEMYEVHTSSKEERNAWMRLIREAVESCPEEEEEYTSESEEEKRAAEARVQKIHKLQESLTSRDQLICSSLEEKLQVYTSLSVLSGRTDGLPAGPRLLVQPQWEEPPLQAAALLAAAVKEAENLKATLSTRTFSPPSDPVTLSSPVTPVPELCDSVESSPDNSSAEISEPLSPEPMNDLDVKVVQSVQSLTQLLYSLQATVAIQDSCYEVQRLLLQESGRPSPRAQRQHLLPGVRGSSLQEQEKQRNLEKQKEEKAAVQRLQEQLRQERERWERECQARESQRGELESRLEERERWCHLEAERLRRDRRELDEQLEEYQQGLERLREGQRNVEKERERLESQQKLLQSWRHGRQRSLPTVIPHMVIPLDGQQEPEPGEPGEHDAERSLFVNEAAFINRRHKRNDPSAHNCLNTLLARSSSRRSPRAQTPRGPAPDPGDWMVGTGCLYSAAGLLELQHSASDHSPRSYVVGEAWPPGGGGANQYQVITGPGDPALDLDDLVGNGSSEEGGEENIVFL